MPHGRVAVDASGKVTWLVCRDHADWQKVEDTHAAVYWIALWPNKPEHGLFGVVLAGSGKQIYIRSEVDWSNNAVVLTPDIEQEIRRVFLTEVYGSSGSFMPSDIAALVSQGSFQHTYIWWPGVCRLTISALAFTVLAASLIYGIPLARARRLERQRLLAMQCPSCGYSLAGLSPHTACPECGGMRSS